MSQQQNLTATAITGAETASPDTPFGALAEFYRAFNGRFSFSGA